MPKLDAVIHLAAQASVPVSIQSFGRSSSSNLLGTVRIVDFCRIKNIPLVYASSSAVYGNLVIGNDEENIIELLSPYATDKFVMELYCKTSMEIYNMSSIGLRFFNVYGPRQDPTSQYSGVISIFIDRIIKNKPITIYGGYQTRDFVFVKTLLNVYIDL